MSTVPEGPPVPVPDEVPAVGPDLFLSPGLPEARYDECNNLTNCTQWTPRFDVAAIEFLDVGQGDGTLIYFPGGEAILIDLGSKKNAVTAGNCAIHYVYCTLIQIQAKYNFKHPTLDILFITHGDGDHYNLLIALKNKFKAAGKELFIKKLVIGGRPRDYSKDFHKEFILPMEKRLVLLADSATDSANVPLKPSWTFDGGIARLFLLSANYLHAKSGPKNPKSIVLMLRYKYKGITSPEGVNIIFMGDAEESVENFIMNEFDKSTLWSDALKLGHHGSKAGSTAEWIKTVKPDLVFVSADMKWAHPYCETLQRVKKNTNLWNGDENVPSHTYLCGEGSGANKTYTMSEKTRIGILANLTKRDLYKNLKKAKASGQKPNTATMTEMENVYGTRYEMTVDSSGYVSISAGSLLPGEVMRLLFRYNPAQRNRRPGVDPQPARDTPGA